MSILDVGQEQEVTNALEYLYAATEQLLMQVSTLCELVIDYTGWLPIVIISVAMYVLFFFLKVDTSNILQFWE